MELAIKQLSDNLKFLQQSKADQKKIALLFNIIKDIKDYYIKSKQYKDELDLIKKQYSDYKIQSESNKMKLEGICLYHGITNLHSLMQRSEGFIIEDVKDYFNNKEFQIPIAIQPFYER